MSQAREPRAASTTATTQALRQALDGSEPLSRLLARVQASRERLHAVTPLVPEEVRPLVQAGPLFVRLLVNDQVFRRVDLHAAMLQKPEGRDQKAECGCPLTSDLCRLTSNL